MRRLDPVSAAAWAPSPAFGGGITLAGPLPWRSAPDPGAKMTGAQALRLRRLCREVGESLAFDERLTGRDAAARIAVLEAELALRLLPPHTD